MWNCPSCNLENADSQTACQNCSIIREIPFPDIAADVCASAESVKSEKRHSFSDIAPEISTPAESEHSAKRPSFSDAAADSCPSVESEHPAKQSSFSDIATDISTPAESVMPDKPLMQIDSARQKIKFIKQISLMAILLILTIVVAVSLISAMQESRQELDKESEQVSGQESFGQESRQASKQELNIDPMANSRSGSSSELESEGAPSEEFSVDTKDNEPPVISGVKNLQVYLGNAIYYKRGITVKDNSDDAVKLEIDSSKVNTKVAGTYEIKYFATDKAGNTAAVNAKITIIKRLESTITQSDVDALSDKVLKSIINNIMTDKRKMWEIFIWTAKYITYTGTSDKSSWINGAYQGMKYGSGDCFSYYAVSRALLTRAGFDVLPVQRVPSSSKHYWVLVKYQGQWYHFDPTPRSTGYAYKCFLRSKPEVEAYTALMSKMKPNYFVYNTAGLPEVATVPLK